MPLPVFCHVACKSIRHWILEKEVEHFLKNNGFFQQQKWSIDKNMKTIAS